MNVCKPVLQNDGDCNAVGLIDLSEERVQSKRRLVVIDSLLDKIFGCAHSRTTFPITPSRRPNSTGNARTGTYVACLACGKEFDYNWKEMRIVNSVGKVRASRTVPQIEQILTR